MAELKETASCKDMPAFDDWLFRNGIRIPESLKKKMKDNYVASVDVLSALKKMGDNSLADVLDQLELNTIENALFNVIISKLEGDSGAIASGTQIMTIVPEIVSISDNKNGSVNLKWKLVQKCLDNNSKNKLKLEWAEDEKSLEFDYANDQIIDTNRIDLQTVYETKNIVIQNLNANIFRLIWRNCSAAKAMRIETDLWDSNHKGQLIQVNGNVIRHTGTQTWNSIYGKIICKAPYTYHWRFKINSFAIYFMFGVARSSNEYSCVSTYFGTKEVGYYAAYQNVNNAYVYNSAANFTGEYGMKRFNKNGCVLDMYLDLRNYTLNFKTGGEDTGVTIANLPHEEYRMIVSLYINNKSNL